MGSSSRRSGAWRFIRLAACLTIWAGARDASGTPVATHELGRPILRYYTPGEHLRGRSNLAVAQDTAGFMWLPVHGDLLSYDGANWDFLKLPTESAGVRQFATTDDGTIFIGGASTLGYLRGAGKNADYVSLIEQLPAAHRNVDEIRQVAAIGHTVYFSDDEKILIWRDRRFAVVPWPTPANSHGARLHRVGDTLYVTALDRPLCRLVHDRIETVADDPVLRENRIISVEAGAAGDALVLLTAERGFFRLEAGRVAPFPTEANRWLAGKRIFRALRLADGSRVVAFSAVSGDGGMRFGADGRYLGPFDASTGLIVKTIRDFFSDREGGLWLGLEQGAVRMEWPSAATLFDVSNGLGQGAVNDVVRHAGMLYAATGEGVFRLVPADEAGRAARFERVLHQSAYALVSHPGGLLALGQSDLFVLGSAGFTVIARMPLGGGKLLRSQRDPSRVWIGTTRGVASVRHTSDGWRKEGGSSGVTAACLGLGESADGALWVATEGAGVFRIGAAGELKRFASEAGLPEKFEQADVGTWAGEPIFTFSTSLRPFRFDAGRRRFEPLAGTEAITGESSQDCVQVGSGTSDTLWLASQTAILQLSRGGGPPQRLPHFMLAAARPVLRLYEETSAEGNVLWIGGARGLVRVEVAKAFVAPVPFAALVSATGVHAGERLDAEHAPIGFSYLAPRQQPASAVVYQTRLIGRDRDWSAWEAKRERSFPHVPPGSYRFEVRARDADGEISAPASLAFVVVPPWWRSWWALLGYAVTGTGVIAGAVRLRTQALRERAARLENLVAERTYQLAQRTSELAQKNVELVRLNQLEFDEKTAARLAEEKARLEVLRYQLNPHFLFNTLASISSALPPAQSTARTMVERLASFCRLTLHRTDDREWTTLGEEMQLLRVYLEIEQSRWGDLLDVTIACDPALEPERLPHFLLLPLVENALKYGRATSPDRVGLRLAARREADGALVLEVSNTGTWLEPSEKKNVSSLGIGLDNLRERLVRYYPRTHELTLAHANGWVTVTLRLTAATPRLEH